MVTFMISRDLNVFHLHISCNFIESCRVKVDVHCLKWLMLVDESWTEFLIVLCIFKTHSDFSLLGQTEYAQHNSFCTGCIPLSTKSIFHCSYPATWRKSLQGHRGAFFCCPRPSLESRTGNLCVLIKSTEDKNEIYLS